MNLETFCQLNEAVSDEKKFDKLISILFSGNNPFEISADLAEWLAKVSPYVIDCYAQVDEENLELYAIYILSIEGKKFSISSRCGFGKEEFYDQFLMFEEVNL